MTSLKTKIQKWLFPLGSVQTIRAGLLKGSKIVVTENTQWAPLLGRWEPAMQKIMASVIKPGDIVYDLGANFGLHGLLFSRLTGQEGFLYNFEPLPQNVLEIENNYKLNKVNNYITIEKAVSYRSETVKFIIGTHAGQGKLTSEEGGKNTREVQTISLDEFIEAGNRPPNFIKMDIEGAEGAALKGYEKNIAKTFPAMVIELHSPEADKQVGQFLNFHGYTAYRFNTFNAIKFERIKDLSLPYPHRDGIWGSIFCLGPGKSLDNFQFNL